MYIENPKTKGSGIFCCIPQEGQCPMGCFDCFFQSGRSYLEPLTENLPNMPGKGIYENKIIRVNDGNDSNVNKEKVLKDTAMFKHKFYNTSIPRKLEEFIEPVVLTLNPASLTDKKVHILKTIPKNLMYVRVRTNVWNLNLAEQAVEYYTKHDIAVILTFLAYYDEKTIPEEHRSNYIYRTRTLNPYYAITTKAWRDIMKKFEDNLRVYGCGKIEGEEGKTSCKYCGNCLREYFATKEKIDAV